MSNNTTESELATKAPAMFVGLRAYTGNVCARSLLVMPMHMQLRGSMSQLLVRIRQRWEALPGSQLDKPSSQVSSVVSAVAVPMWVASPSVGNRALPGPFCILH